MSEPTPNKPRKWGRRKPSYTPERLRAVAELLALGWSIKRITDAIMTKFEVSPRTVANYIAMVIRDRSDSAPKDLDAARDEIRSMTLSLYEKCIADKQYAAAQRSLDRLIKLCGLDVQKHEISGPGGAPLAIASTVDVDLTSLDVDEHTKLGELLKKARAARAAVATKAE